MKIMKNIQWLVVIIIGMPFLLLALLFSGITALIFRMRGKRHADKV